MYVTTCLSYDEVTLVLIRAQESIAVQLKSDKNINITVTLQPMQCKIIGEALINAAGQMPVYKVKDNVVGSVQVEFNLENEQEGEPCRQESLSAKSLFKIA